MSTKPAHPMRSPMPLLLIMAAVLVWGLIHALGAYLFNMDFRKALIVYGCVGFFLGGWLLLLTMRQRRVAALMQAEKLSAEAPEELPKS